MQSTTYMCNQCIINISTPSDYLHKCYVYSPPKKQVTIIFKQRTTLISIYTLFILSKQQPANDN